MQSQINLDSLQLLKRAFDEADANQSGDLDMEEFCEKLGPVLGGDWTQRQLSQLFMKIDADCGGSVSWEEFTNYFFLTRKAALKSGGQVWRFVAQEFKSKHDAVSHHRDTVDKIIPCPELKSYFSCSRDGSVRMWRAADLGQQRVFRLGSAWVNDCVYMPEVGKLACATADHAICFVDPESDKAPATRGGSASPAVARVVIANADAVPLCLSAGVVGSSDEQRVLYGDSHGAVAVARYPQAEGQSYGTLNTPPPMKPVETIHTDHKDWVTQVLSVQSLGIVSCSLDCTIRIADAARGRVHCTVSLHEQGVSAFAYSRLYSLVASGGLDRNVLLWQPSAPRSKAGILSGHSAAITHISMDHQNSQVMSLSSDSVIKVWDLRTQGCLQTISPLDWGQPEDANPTAICFDSGKKRLVSIKHRPAVWSQKCISDLSSSHETPLVGALVNASFDMVASGDESGTICMWDLTTGKQESHMNEAHGSAKLVSMTYDSAQRRMITGGSDGRVRMWNATSGALLREFKHSQRPLEVCAVLYLHDKVLDSHQVVAGGWDKKVCVWDDTNDAEVTRCKAMPGHREDILCLAYSSPGLLASGDWGGSILLWSMQASEKRMALQQSSAQGRPAAEALAFLPSTNHRASNILLCCGGDGLLRVYFVGFSPDARACFRQVGWWQAHAGRIATVQVLQDRDMVLMASHDCQLSLWTLQGGLVGRFGTHTWRLDDISTFQDPKGTSTQQIQEEADPDPPTAPTENGNAKSDVAAVRVNGTGDRDTEEDATNAAISAIQLSNGPQARHADAWEGQEILNSSGRLAMAHTVAMQTSKKGLGGSKGELIHSTLKLPPLTPIPSEEDLRVPASRVKGMAPAQVRKTKTTQDVQSDINARAALIE
ncbi:hypothetical protein WJX73_001378 [Symbiochloris irregularis]|uniref:EF-hand domain-containing protein n=1 Tax=Symbiochloris irregularis TaxID=706552 RepID=A0AAW1PFZ4_9CHLO